MQDIERFFDKGSMEFLEDYVNTYSPTTMEKEGQQKWLERIKPYVDTHMVDNYGTAVGVLNPDAEQKVVIEAHADEISWRVHYISDDGFIYVTRNGGSDHQIAPSKRVVIHTRSGEVPAVFGWPAIHTRDKTNETPPKQTNIFLDCGCDSREEVEELGVHVGCIATYNDPFMILNKKFFVGRALDNRIGGFIISQVAKTLKEDNVDLPFGLYFVNSVQEEVGLRGASMITETIRPDVAIVTDVCHDTTTPMVDKIKNGDFAAGKGPVLTYGPAVQNNLLDLILDSAEKHRIPFQRRAASRATGTDTDAFAYSTGGVPSALVAIPERYMHTTVEMIRREDVGNAIRLIAESLKDIQDGHDFRYFK